MSFVQPCAAPEDSESLETTAADAYPQFAQELALIDTDEVVREVTKYKSGNDKDAVFADSSVAKHIQFEPVQTSDAVFKVPAPKQPTIKQAVSPPPTPRSDGYGDGQKRKYTYNPNTDSDLDLPILFSIKCRDKPAL